MYIDFTRRAGQTWLSDQDTQAIRFIETPRNEAMLSLVEGFDGDLDGCDRPPDRYRQIGQMVQKTYTARLYGDRWRLERMLEKLSEDRVIDRLGLKERQARIVESSAGSELPLQAVPQRRSDIEQGGST